MAAAIFPAYLLARMVVSQRWAFFAAVGDDRGAGALLRADPRRGALGLSGGDARALAQVRAIDRPGGRALALAVGALPAGRARPLAARRALRASSRFGVLAPGAGARARMRRWRPTLDALGLGRRGVTLAVGALIAIVAFLGHRSGEWETRRRRSGRTGWSSTASGPAGAFAIGVGILPVIALLACSPCPHRSATPGRPRLRRRRRRRRGRLRLVRGDQGRLPLDHVLEPDRRAEPHLPDAARVRRHRLPAAGAPRRPSGRCSPPARRCSRWCSRCRSTAGSTTTRTTRRTGSRSSRSRTASSAWPLGRIELVVVVIVAARDGRAPRRRARASAPRRSASRCPSAIAVARARLERDRRDLRRDRRARLQRTRRGELPQAERLGRPRRRGRLGRPARPAAERRPARHPTTEFWNRSIQKVWSVDGTGPGPGDTLTPDLQDVDGTLWPDPETDYVLATNGVEVVGPEVARNDAANATLVRLDGPIRLRANRTGIAADGWTQGVTGDPTFPPALRTTASTSPTAASAPRS